MTPEEKITALVEHIKKEFPKGCDGVLCSECPVDGFEHGTAEHAVCELLGEMDAYNAWDY